MLRSPHSKNEAEEVSESILDLTSPSVDGALALVTVDTLGALGFLTFLVFFCFVDTIDTEGVALAGAAEIGDSDESAGGAGNVEDEGERVNFETQF